MRQPCLEVMGMMQDEARVTVVIINHNYARFVEEAIESALHQTLACHVIVVDDGSTDDSIARIRNYPVELVAQANFGLARAAAAGVAAVRSPLLVLLSADDVLHQRFVERALLELEKCPAAAFVYTGAYLFGPHLGLAGNGARFHALPFSRERLLRGNYILGTTLIRRDAWILSGGLDGSLVVLEDWDQWLTLADRGEFGIPLDEPLFFYRHHSPTTRNKARRDVLATAFRIIWLRHGHASGVISRAVEKCLHMARRVFLAALSLLALAAPRLARRVGNLGALAALPGPLLVPIPMNEAAPAFPFLASHCHDRESKRQQVTGAGGAALPSSCEEER